MHPSLQFTRSLNTKNSAGLLVADSCTQLLNFLLQLPWARFQNVAYRADRSYECKPTLTQCEQQLSQIYSVLYSQHMITVKSTYTHLKLYLCPRSSRKHGNVADTLGTQVPRHWSQTAPPQFGEDHWHEVHKAVGQIRSWTSCPEVPWPSRQLGSERAQQ